LVSEQYTAIQALALETNLPFSAISPILFKATGLVIIMNSQGWTPLAVGANLAASTIISRILFAIGFSKYSLMLLLVFIASIASILYLAFRKRLSILRL
jgi:hypothetical protein